MKRLLLIFVFLSSQVSAQRYFSYHTGVGARAGKFNTGLTFKHFFNADNATGIQVEAYYANVASGGYTGKFFLIKQNRFKIPIIQLPLDFVYGAGVHAGYFPFEVQGYYKRVKKDANYYEKSVVSMGADITLQIEYKIPKVPLTFSIECVPFYEFVNPGPEYVDFGVALRYVFK
jgi:hypothetical protein